MLNWMLTSSFIKIVKLIFSLDIAIYFSNSFIKLEFKNENKFWSLDIVRKYIKCIVEDTFGKGEKEVNEVQEWREYKMGGTLH